MQSLLFVIKPLSTPIFNFDHKSPGTLEEMTPYKGKGGHLQAKIKKNYVNQKKIYI